MTSSDEAALQALLGECLCHGGGVEHRPDGELMLQTHFKFPDGDSYPFYLSKLPSGSLRLSDNGHTLMHISFEHDIDSFPDGIQEVHLERIMGETGVSKDGGAFHIDTTIDDLPEAIFTLGQALTRIYERSQAP